MNPNIHTADVEIILLGKPYKVRYDWAAIAQLKAELGDKFDTVIAEASVDWNMQVIATALEIGLTRHHPNELTAEKIHAISPPVLPMTKAINEGFNMAFHGSLEVPEDDDHPTMLTRLIKKIGAWSVKRRSGPTNTD